MAIRSLVVGWGLAAGSLSAEFSVTEADGTPGSITALFRVQRGTLLYHVFIWFDCINWTHLAPKSAEYGRFSVVKGTPRARELVST